MESSVLRKKLIEVALPLDAINKASAKEKSIRHGHPSTLHLWWARRPLAAARAVIFAQMVDDPSGWPEEFPTAWRRGKQWTRSYMGRKGGEQPEREVYLRTLANLRMQDKIKSLFDDFSAR